MGTYPGYYCCVCLSSCRCPDVGHRNVDTGCSHINQPGTDVCILQQPGQASEYGCCLAVGAGQHRDNLPQRHRILLRIKLQVQSMVNVSSCFIGLS